MTVDELWDETKELFPSKGKPPPPDQLGPKLHGLIEALIGTPQGRERLRTGLAQTEGPSRKPRFYEHLCQTLQSSQILGAISARERSDLLESTVEACRTKNRKDRSYWRLLWLWCR